MEPLFKFRRLIFADRLFVTFICLANGYEKSMIWELFNMGDNLATNQNSSVQSKKPVIQALFKFREIVLGYPFFSGFVDRMAGITEAFHVVVYNNYIVLPWVKLTDEWRKIFRPSPE